MGHRAMSIAVLGVCLFSTAGADAVLAQEAPAGSEEIERRVVGAPGMASIGVAGFVDRFFFSSEEVMPATYTVQVDGARFLTSRIAVRLGVSGTGRFGGESDDEPSGAGAPSLHGMSGVLFYFTPRSLLSLYVGSECWLQITRRAASDRGSVLGKAGVHGTLSSRARFSVEAGAGAALTKGSEGELLTRFVGQVGLRIKL